MPISKTDYPLITAGYKIIAKGGRVILSAEDESTAALVCAKLNGGFQVRDAFYEENLAPQPDFANSKIPGGPVYAKWFNEDGTPRG